MAFAVTCCLSLSPAKRAGSQLPCSSSSCSCVLSKNAVTLAYHVSNCSPSIFRSTSLDKSRKSAPTRRMSSLPKMEQTLKENEIRQSLQASHGALLYIGEEASQRLLLWGLQDLTLHVQNATEGFLEHQQAADSRKTSRSFERSD